MSTAVVRKEWLRCFAATSSIVVDPPHLASLEVGSPELHFLDGGMGEVEAHYIHSSMNELLQNRKLLRSRADGRHDLGKRSVAVVGMHSLAFVIAIEPNRGLEGWAGPCRDGREGCGRNGPATSGSRSSSKEITTPDCPRSAAGDGDGSADHGRRLYRRNMPQKNGR